MVLAPNQWQLGKFFARKKAEKGGKPRALGMTRQMESYPQNRPCCPKCGGNSLTNGQEGGEKEVPEETKVWF